MAFTSSPPSRSHARDAHPRPCPRCRCAPCDLQYDPAHAHSVSACVLRRCDRPTTSPIRKSRRRLRLHLLARPPTARARPLSPLRSLVDVYGVFVAAQLSKFFMGTQRATGRPAQQRPTYAQAPIPKPAVQDLLHPHAPTQPPTLTFRQTTSTDRLEKGAGGRCLRLDTVDATARFIIPLVFLPINIGPISRRLWAHMHPEERVAVAFSMQARFGQGYCTDHHANASTAMTTETPIKVLAVSPHCFAFLIHLLAPSHH
ncbi:hypothetical protein B0H15DRAFT_607944 [Mycena belliarum]|uniref:Uncharacterized protein n=1 Tax=Mycena belliarum TaxID=1033014 RepID=A0AAD6TUF2_9AGAR|nr:hypothetical protein B0H15DRAFT_607944 [Mycena belliae]